MSNKKELIKELEAIEKSLNERRKDFKELLQKLKEEEEFLSKNVAKLFEALKVMIE